MKAKEIHEVVIVAVIKEVVPNMLLERSEVVDKLGIQKQKQRLKQRMRLHYKIAIEQIEQVRIDVT